MKRTKLLISILTLILISTSVSNLTTAQTPPTGPQPLFTLPQKEPEIIETSLPGGEGSPNLEIKIKNNSVYIKAINVTLKEILTGLAKEANFEVSLGSSSDKISTTIEGLTVEETIYRLMKIIQEGNYHIYYDDKGRIKRLEVFSLSERPSAPQIHQRSGIPRFRIPQTPSPQVPQPPQSIQPPATLIPQQQGDQ